MAKHRDLFDPTDPARLQPEQRLTEVAAIVGAGVIRLRQKRQAVAAPNVRARPGPGSGRCIIDGPHHRMHVADFTGIRRNSP